MNNLKKDMPINAIDGRTKLLTLGLHALLQKYSDYFKRGLTAALSRSARFLDRLMTHVVAELLTFLRDPQKIASRLPNLIQKTNSSEKERLKLSLFPPSENQLCSLSLQLLAKQKRTQDTSTRKEATIGRRSSTREQCGSPPPPRHW